MLRTCLGFNPNLVLRPRSRPQQELPFYVVGRAAASQILDPEGSGVPIALLLLNDESRGWRTDYITAAAHCGDSVRSVSREVLCLQVKVPSRTVKYELIPVGTLARAQVRIRGGGLLARGIRFSYLDDRGRDVGAAEHSAVIAGANHLER